MRPEVFVVYKFTGVPAHELEALLVPVCDTLKSTEVGVYCSFFDEAEFQQRGWGVRQIMLHAFAIIESCDILLVILNSNDKSEGMIGEVMRYLGVKPIILAVHTDVDQSATHLPKLADVLLEWSSVPQLCEKLTETFRDPDRRLSLVPSPASDSLAWLLPDQRVVGSGPEVHTNPTRPRAATSTGGRVRDTVDATPVFDESDRRFPEVGGFSPSRGTSCAKHLEAPGQSAAINDPPPTGPAAWQHDGHIPM